MVAVCSSDRAAASSSASACCSGGMTLQEDSTTQQMEDGWHVAFKICSKTGEDANDFASVCVAYFSSSIFCSASEML